MDSWEISQDFVSCLHKTSNQTLVQLYFSFAAEVINYLTWKTLANTILQNHQWINKIHRVFTALKRIIIEDLKRCRAREWELNGASCCFTDSFRAIWNYILITFSFLFGWKISRDRFIVHIRGCQLVMLKWFDGNRFENSIDFWLSGWVEWNLTFSSTLKGEWVWKKEKWLEILEFFWRKLKT